MNPKLIFQNLEKGLLVPVRYVNTLALKWQTALIEFFQIELELLVLNAKTISVKDEFEFHKLRLELVELGMWRKFSTKS